MVDCSFFERGRFRFHQYVFPRLALFLGIALAAPVNAGPVDKVNVRRTGGSYNAAITLIPADFSVAGHGSIAGVCDPIIAALVVPSGVTISIDSVTQDQAVADLDPDIADEPLLAAALENANGKSEPEYFDPKIQDLYTVRFFPNDCSLQSKTVIEITFRPKFKGGGAHELARFTGGATNESDIDDGAPLNNFILVDEPVRVDAVPAASTWGLIALSLLLLIGHRVRFRPIPQSVAN